MLIELIVSIILFLCFVCACATTYVSDNDDSEPNTNIEENHSSNNNAEENHSSNNNEPNVEENHPNDVISTDNDHIDIINHGITGPNDDLPCKTCPFVKRERKRKKTKRHKKYKNPFTK